MGFETHVFKIDGQKKVFTTCNDFWECECDVGFYHAYTESKCSICNAEKDDSPDARVEEMLEKLNGKNDFLEKFRIGYVFQAPSKDEAFRMAKMTGAKYSVAEYPANRADPALGYFFLSEVGETESKVVAEYNAVKGVFNIHETTMKNGTMGTAFDNRQIRVGRAGFGPYLLLP